MTLAEANDWFFGVLYSKVNFWQSAFHAAWDRAKCRNFAAKQWESVANTNMKGWRAIAKRLKSVEESYCDAALQLLALDREHQLLKLRTPTQLNEEYERQVLAVSMERPDASPTKQFEAKAGKELINTVEALATSIAASFERCGLLTAPPRSTQAQLLEEIRNLFDGCGVYNWPVHSGRIADQSKRVQQLRDFSGSQKAIDV